MYRVTIAISLMWASIVIFPPTQQLAAQSLAAQSLPTLNPFPTVEAENLRKEQKSLPQQLPASLNIVVFSFEREHGSVAEGWSDYLRAYAEGAGIPYVNVVVIGDDVPKFVRGLIANGMRRELPKSEQERFFVLFPNRERFLRQYGVEPGGELLILLISSSGASYPLSRGAITDARKDMFTKNLAAIQDSL